MRGPSARLLGLLLLAVPVAPTLLLPGLALISAEAEARPRSSGGYSRPSGGYSRPSAGRTPSFGGGLSRPSSSGGYSRPQSSGARPSFPSFGGSAADRDYGRTQSGDALRRMREAETAARRRAEEAQRPSPGTSTGGGFGLPVPRSRTPSSSGRYDGGWTGGGWSNPSAGGWYRDRGWSVPGNVLSGPRSYGIWDAAFLWFLLSSLSRPGHADFFRNHQDDPGYRAWRQEAEQRAQGDAETRRQLDDLDRRLAEGANQPRDPNYLPPDVPPEVATGREAPPPEDQRTPSVQADGSGGMLGSMGGLLVLGLGVAGFVAWRRSGNRAAPGGGTGMTTGDTLRSAGGMLRHKMSGEGYAPSRFRLGTTLTLDPTPFLLLAGTTQVQPPASAGERVSVTEIGRIGDGAGSLLRLYLPEGRAMLQLHLDAQGEADECRYFSLLDEVAPADEAEWGAWLDPAEGMIGWPEFQTRDGKIYGRAWAPGSSRVPPRAIEELVEAPQGQRTVRSQAMLYAAPTGLAAPAPATEYILVSAIEDGSQAWVEIRAGIDVNPSSLSPT